MRVEGFSNGDFYFIGETSIIISAMISFWCDTINDLYILLYLCMIELLFSVEYFVVILVAET